MSSKQPEQLSPEGLRHFTGSEHWYRGTINPNMLFTDGAKHVADCGGAYWLLDEIALIQPYNKRVAAEEFQVWTLKVDLVRHSGILTCEDGNGNKVFQKTLDFTDFPVPEITLWFANNTIFLPSEYWGAPAMIAPKFIDIDGKHFNVARAAEYIHYCQDLRLPDAARTMAALGNFGA